MLLPVACLAGLALASLFCATSIAQSVDTEGSPSPMAASDPIAGIAAIDRAVEGATPSSAPDRCPSSQRNPEQSSIFDPTCNAYLIARTNANPERGVRLAIVPLAIDPGSRSRPERVADMVASAKALSRSPIAMPRDARFNEGYLAVPASYHALEDRLRIDANAQLMRPEPHRVGLSLAAAAEFQASPFLKLRAQTNAHSAPDGLALTYGAGAEVEPLPTLRLRAQTEFDEQTSPRYVIGARCEIVPRRLDLEMSGNRQPGVDAENWVWRTQLTFRAPFLN